MKIRIMEYYRNTFDFHIAEPSVISLGKFDGLHEGHRLLLDKMQEGKKQGLKTIALTFNIPPKSLSGEKIQVLSTNREKEMIFERAGIDVLIELPFTPKFRSMMPYEFLKFLTDHICVRMIVTGTDFHFGYKRSGDYKTLQQYAQSFGYRAEVVEKLQDQGEDISSTRIRNLIAGGDMEYANRLLGYPYFLTGEVVHGQALGRTANIPTANQKPPAEKLLPPYGVYISEIEIDGKNYFGISNIGKKPTVGDDNPVGVETSIFDFDRDIYGKNIRVSFLKFLRREKKFDSFEQLKVQMETDISYAKDYINGLHLK